VFKESWFSSGHRGIDAFLHLPVGGNFGALLVEYVGARQHVRNAVYTTWVQVPPADAKLGGVFDVKSGAPGNGGNGKQHAEW